MIKLLQDIRKLASKRGWKTKSIHFILHEDMEYLIIARWGIGKYLEEFSKNITHLNITEHLKKLDEQLLYVIRKELPAAKKVSFKFYSSYSSYRDETDKVSGSLIVYPPEITNH